MELRIQPRAAAAAGGAAQDSVAQDAAAQSAGAAGRTLKRVPAFARWVEQDAITPTQWCARIWRPEQPYRFRCRRPPRVLFPRIYEAHVGMAQADTAHHGESVGNYTDFIQEVLPRIKADGYTAVQLMGVLEHPLYRSFGYQVSSYFAPTSRCGTPDQFKALVDAAHGLGLAVLLDIPHGHACPNTEQGLAAYDGSRYFFKPQYNQWGTPAFDFSQELARRFLLSNCRYWLEEFRVDGFRFDAVGNILYLDHGLDDDFSHVGRCFYGKDNQPRADVDGELYLCLANALTHEIYPGAVTIAEEFSGMPGLTCPPEEGGLGFDCRFAMVIPDYWAHCVQHPRDMGSLWHEMTNHRPYDRTVSYVECHDQCINGEDAMILAAPGPGHVHRHEPGCGRLEDLARAGFLPPHALYYPGCGRCGLPQLHGQRIRPPGMAGRSSPRPPPVAAGRPEGPQIRCLSRLGQSPDAGAGAAFFAGLWRKPPLPLHP